MPRTGATIYLIASVNRARPYVGLMRQRLASRLREHNRGEVRSTASHRPWCLRAAFWFRDVSIAAAFERYLKSGSGRAFAKRHFGNV